MQFVYKCVKVYCVECFLEVEAYCDGSFFLLKPLVITLFILCSAVVVECLRLNPCWCGGMIILFVMYGRMIFF